MISRPAALPPVKRFTHECDVCINIHDDVYLSVEAALKLDRHNAIRDLLHGTAVPNQDALRRRLADRGFHVTQATLSRDIHEMRLSKGPAGYTLPRTDNDEEDSLPGIAEVLRSFGLEVRLAMNQVVLITTTGGAQPIAATLDYEDWPEIVGTIAGDDAVLVICPDPAAALAVRSRLETLLA